jgi:hypothetical protein
MQKNGRSILPGLRVLALRVPAQLRPGLRVPALLRPALRVPAMSLPVILTVVLGGCSWLWPAAPGPANQQGILDVQSAHGDGPGISIEAALAKPGQLLLVNGALFVGSDGTAWLCSLEAESYPPQCGGSRLKVLHLERASLPALKSASGLRWLDSAQLLGTVRSS